MCVADLPFGGCYLVFCRRQHEKGCLCEISRQASLGLVYFQRRVVNCAQYLEDNFPFGHSRPVGYILPLKLCSTNSRDYWYS